jgi:hypothetical protein
MSIFLSLRSGFLSLRLSVSLCVPCQFFLLVRAHLSDEQGACTRVAGIGLRFRSVFAADLFFSFFPRSKYSI